MRAVLVLLVVAWAARAQDETEEDRPHLKDAFGDPVGPVGPTEPAMWRVTEEMDEERCEMWSKEGDKIFWDYKGTLLDGKVFDQGKFEAVLGSGQVIKGVDAAMRDMCPGERRRMKIQPEWAYGERGFSDLIPPNSVLIFDVQLLKIKRGSKTAVYKDEL